MWEPIPGENFEPSVDAKDAWTFTRKSAYTPAVGMRFPGLFTTKGFDTDALAVVAVIGLEAWGLVSLVSSFGLVDIGGNFNWLGVGGVIAAFILDVVLAIGRHLPVGRECRYENKYVLAKTEPEKMQLRIQRGQLRWLAPICAALILALAAVKIWLFYMLNEDVGITGLTASVIVSYLLAAIIHINNTGYFLAALWFNNKVKRDYRIWASAGSKAHEVTIYKRREFPITIPEGNEIIIRLGPVGEHLIRAGEKDKGEAHFVLETYGVLTDRGLTDLIGKQPNDDAQAIVARVGLAAQLRILDTAPPLPDPTDGRDDIQQGRAIGREQAAPASSDKIPKERVG
jgi:hypothetical protein